MGGALDACLTDDPWVRVPYYIADVVQYYLARDRRRCMTAKGRTEGNKEIFEFVMSERQHEHATRENDLHSFDFLQK